MFNNRFNSKNDPILEAVTSAMQDGEMRRQAEALVNEEFGVYSRKAVVREDLAAYDARLEEAYKCMKEGKPLADKDYDKDGKVESPKDEVWGSRFRAAKKAGKMEEGAVDAGSMEGSKSVTKSAPKEDPSTPKVPYSQLPKTGNRAGAVIDSSKGALKEDEQLDELKQSTVRSYIEKSMGAAKEKREAGFKKDFTEKKGKKADKARGEFHKRTKGLSMAAKKLAEQELDEAKYSAKAARAGEDIGKPGKNFSKIAKKAGERYGSEEKGKKVAGAILAKIRAKHMKEENIQELSQFGAAFAAARKSGQSDFKFGGKSFTTQMKGSSTPTPPSRPADLGASKPVGDAGYKSGSTVSLKPIGGDGTAMAADNTPAAPRPAPTPGWKSPKPVDQGATVSASGGTPSVQSATKAPTSAPLPPSRPADLGASKPMQNPDQNLTKVKSLKESVQVGENTYRIV